MCQAIHQVLKRWLLIGLTIVATVSPQNKAIALELDDDNASNPPEVSPELIENINRLYSKNPLRRQAAIKSLSEMGSDASYSAPFLVAILSDKTVLIVPDSTQIGQHEEPIAQLAHDAIIRIGSASIPPLKAAIRSSPDTQTRALAASAMDRIIFGPSPRIDRRKNKPIARYTVDDECIDLWLDAIKDTDERVRYYATNGLAHAGADSVAPVLLLALEDESDDVRLAAIKGLGRLRESDAVSKIVPFLGQENLQRVAQEALEQIGAPAVQELISAIEDEDCAYRDRAGWTLYGISDPAALPELHEALNHGEPLVRDWAAHALARIADERSLEPLLEAIDDPSPDVRGTACWAIGLIQGDSQIKALEPLIDVLHNDASWQPRNLAAFALSKMRSRHPEVHDDVLAALTHAMTNDDHEVVRASASEHVAKWQNKRED